MLQSDESALPQHPPDSGDATASASVDALPSHMDFARQVRASRLDLFWKITFFAMIVAVWSLIVTSGRHQIATGPVLLTGTILGVGCLAAGVFLHRGSLNRAVWSYALGAILAIGLVTAGENAFSSGYAAYLFILVMVIVGLLAPTRTTALLLGVTVVAAFGFPLLSSEEFVLSRTTAFALALTTLAAVIAGQIGQDLDVIAEWALENCRRERHTSIALFANREALEKSFMRQAALTQELQKTNRELEGAHKATERARSFRGQFVAQMSHELRTPLNAIIGFSQTMLDFPDMYDGVALPAPYREDIDQILHSGQHLLAILNDILDLSKMDAGKVDIEILPVDLTPIVNGVLATAFGLLGDKSASVALLHDLPDSLPMVLGDPLRIRQVLLNLMSNAVKFTEAGHIKLTVRPENSHVVFIVEDTGIGIADSDKPLIFKEFGQGAAGRRLGRESAGLGLAIAQRLVRLMNGWIWFTSALGEGSTFTFALPLATSEVPAASENSSRRLVDTLRDEQP